jgi:hypothetical protein
MTARVMPLAKALRSFLDAYGVLPALADGVKSQAWFIYPDMSRAPVQQIAAAKAAKRALEQHIADGRIRLRGVLEPGRAPIDIDPIDAMHGRLDVFNATLDFQGRKYTFVHAIADDVAVVVHELATPRPSPPAEVDKIADVAQERLLPPNRAGHPEEYDWDEAEAFALGLLEKDGIPWDPQNKKPGWRTQGDLERAVALHLAEKLGGDRGPHPATVRRHIPPWIKKFEESEAARN